MKKAVYNIPTAAANSPEQLREQALGSPIQRELPAARTRQVAAQVGIPTNSPEQRGHAPRYPQVYESQNRAVARLERTGEALRQARELKIDHVPIQAGNIRGGVVRAEVIEEQERKLVCQGIEMTDEGDVTLREYVRTERFFLPPSV